MFKSFRHWLIAFSVLVAFTVFDVQQASAVIDPFTVSLGVSALIHAAVIGGAYVGWRTYKRENGSTRNPSGTKVTPQGTIGRDVRVEWVDLTQTDFVSGKNVTAKIPYSQIASAVKGNPTKYPNLKAAIDKSETNECYADDGPNAEWQVGESFEDSSTGYYYTVTGVHNTSVQNGTNTVNKLMNTPTWSSALNSHYVTKLYSGSPTYKLVTYLCSPTGTKYAPPRPAQQVPPEFAVNISGSSSAPTDVYSDYYGEIDDYLTEQGGTLSFIDSDDSSSVDTSPPFVVPPMPSLHEFIASQSTRDALQASGAALDSARLAVTAAQGAVDTARANYDLSGSPSDAQKLADALKALADSQAAFDKLKAELAKQAADDAKKAAEDEADNAAQLGGAGDVPDLNFSRFQELKGALSTTYPFSLIGMLPDLLSPFVSSPSAPVIHLPVYGNDLVVDLSIFDPVAAVCRWCVGLLSSAGVVYYIVHFWRGVS